VQDGSCLRLEDADDVDSLDIRLVFNILFASQLAFVGFRCQLVNASLQGRIRSQISDSPRDVGSETLSQWVKEPIECRVV